MQKDTSEIRDYRSNVEENEQIFELVEKSMQKNAQRKIYNKCTNQSPDTLAGCVGLLA